MPFGDNACYSDHGQTQTLQLFRRNCAPYGSLLIRFIHFAALALFLGACQASPDAAATAQSGAGSLDAPHDDSCGPHAGFLNTELFGAIDAKIQWTSPGLVCEGMPRPAGSGARLRFAGELDAGQRIAFIIGLPGLDAGNIARELPSNVTLIEEGAGRFFNTAEHDICWTDITAVDDIGGSDARFGIAGRLYCVAPLVEVNGDSEISIRDLAFRGVIDWDAS